MSILEKEGLRLILKSLENPQKFQLKFTNTGLYIAHNFS